MRSIWPPRAACTSSRPSLDGLSVPGPRVIGQDHDAGAECPGADELQCVRNSLAEERQTPAREQRMNPELECVEQVSFQQGPRKQPMPVDEEVPALLLLELRRFGGDV